jgi:drug/metabolite transporter (DMT)-like permease
MVLSQKSIKREHPSIVTVVQASDILFAIILQNLFSINKSNGLALIGSTLVLASIIIVGVHKLWQDRQNRTCIPTSIQENK